MNDIFLCVGHVWLMRNPGECSREGTKEMRAHVLSGQYQMAFPFCTYNFGLSLMSPHLTDVTFYVRAALPPVDVRFAMNRSRFFDVQYESPSKGIILILGVCE